MTSPNTTAERPSILTAWRAEREAARAGIRNDVTDSGVVKSGDPRVLEFFGASPAAAGVYVTPVSAMRVSAVFACVARIAGAVAGMPMHIYKRTSGGDRERIEDAPLWWLLNEQPTARYIAASHWEHVISNELLRGDGFTFIGRSPLGAPRELIPMPWDGVRRERAGDRLKYYVNDGLRTWGVDQDDMLHFPGFGFDGMCGMSVIKWAASNAAGNALAMDEYSGRFFANGAHHSIVLEAEKKMSDDAISNLQTAFGNKYSGLDNAHRLPLVLTEGITAKEVSISAEDAQLLEARKFQVVDIARAFGVPPHMIGESSASTSWGSGLESMNRGFVQYTVQPHLRRIEQEINRKLFRTAGRFAEFDREAMLEGDSQSQANYYAKALGGPGSGPGYMSPDEIRKKKNLPARGGKYAEIYYPDAKQAAPTKGTSNEDPEAPAAAP